MRLLMLTLIISSCMPRPDANTTNENKRPPADTGSTPAAPRTVYDFSNDEVLSEWRVEDDTVMGGRSDGHFETTEEGHGRFFGDVSLENNGGFSSVQHRVDEPYTFQGRKAFQLRVKGDGKTYNFRVKRPGERFSFTYAFETSGDWETITIPFSSMRPVFRGYNVDVPNYGGEPVRGLRFLIGNKKPQTFELLIDVIEVI